MYLLHFQFPIHFSLHGALTWPTPTCTTGNTDRGATSLVRLGRLAKFFVAITPGLLLEGNLIGVAWRPANGAREAFRNSMTTTIGGSSLRPRLNVAAANVVGSDIVLLGWRGDGRLDRRSRGSLGGTSTDAGDVGGRRFAKKDGKARHNDTGNLILLVVGDDFVLLLFQHDLDVLVRCLANMLGDSGPSGRDLHVAWMYVIIESSRESPFPLPNLDGIGRIPPLT